MSTLRTTIPSSAPPAPQWSDAEQRWIVPGYVAEGDANRTLYFAAGIAGVLGFGLGALIGRALAR